MSDPHAHTGHAHAADELDADEPRTPMWLPLLGGILFLSGAIFMLATSSNEPAPSAGEEAPAAETAAAAEPQAAPAPPPSQPQFRVQRVPEGNIERVMPPPGAPGAPPPGVAPQGAPPNAPGMAPGVRMLPRGEAPTEPTRVPPSQQPRPVAPAAPADPHAGHGH